MCRYAYKTYKQRFACFACRKAFKRRRPDDVTPAVARSGRRLEPARCPQCRGVMHDMGMDFKAPRRTDAKQWEKVELLFGLGFSYHSCGCCGPGLLPAELNEVQSFLAGTLNQTDVRKLLKTLAERQRERRRNNRARPARVAREVTGRTWGPEYPPRRPGRFRRPVKAKPPSVFQGPARKRGKKKAGTK
jgi:hypothetical protein